MGYRCYLDEHVPVVGILVDGTSFDNISVAPASYLQDSCGSEWAQRCAFTRKELPSVSPVGFLYEHVSGCRGSSRAPPCSHWQLLKAIPFLGRCIWYLQITKE